MAKKLSALHQDAIPYLYYRDPGAAAEFCVKAFGFTLRGMQRDDDGGVMHAELGLGKSAVMMGPAREEYEYRSPLDLPARHAGIFCYVDDADAHCAHARAAGATIVREPCDQFYGVREYTTRDLEGQEWFFVTPLSSATPRAKRRVATKVTARARTAKRKSKAAKKK